MIDYLLDNIGTIIVAIILIAMVEAISVKLMKNKKQGKSSCGCNCSHCGMNGQCCKNVKVNKA